MKTLKLLIFCLALLVHAHVFGQVTAPANTPIFGHYVGFDATSVIPLPIRNDGPQPIQWFTDGTRRMTLSSNGNIALGNNLDPITVVKFLINQNRPTGIGVIASATTDNLVGIQSRVNTASSGNPFSARNTSFFAEIAATGDNLLSNIGYRAEVSGLAITNYGGLMIAKNSLTGTLQDHNIGIRALGYIDNVQPNETANNFGVIGEACGGRVNIGIYGSEKPTLVTDCSSLVGENWSGYFTGSVLHMGPVIAPSDELLKQNITPLENAIELLAQLAVKSYEFKTDEYDFLSLPQGTRYGLISQEVEGVIPHLIRDFTHPAFVDTLGEMISPEVSIKGLNYIELIPLLIAGFNEQNEALQLNQNEVVALEQKLTLLEEQFDALHKTMESIVERGQTRQSFNESEAGSLQLGQNFPNPFSDHTSIDFNLPDDAQVVLEISDSQGRKLDKLIDGHMAAGTHSATWDGSRYSPGMYYYSLYANGQLLTKKMIKR